MDLGRIRQLGGKLVAFLDRFRGCFGRCEGPNLLGSYVRGQLSSCQRKSIEPMALQTGTKPRTLQGFLESVKWDEEKLRDRCQDIVSNDHAHPRAIGLIDESGSPKCGSDTAGVGRQWCGHSGKVDNCVVGVHVGYVTDDFQCLLDGDVYLSKDWAEDFERRRKAHIPDEVQFRTKPEIAQEQIDRALSHGIRVAAWTFDELYGRDSKFLDFVELKKDQHFVAEVPSNFRGWLRSPKILHNPPKNCVSKSSSRKKYPRLARNMRACKVNNLAQYSPVFRSQDWQRFRVKDSEKGPVVWEVKTARFFRKQSDGMPSRPSLLIVARNVLNPDEVKYFVANRVPDEDSDPNGKLVTLAWLLWVAFRRWPVERIFREAKNELGMDHYEVRGWRCVHRHFYITILSHLFCARMRQEYSETSEVGKLTVEQVRRAMTVWFEVADLPPRLQDQRCQRELEKMEYYQRRNKAARKSHTKTRLKRLEELGIEMEGLESCIPQDTS
jgi:SRSO17 transposase